MKINVRQTLIGLAAAGLLVVAPPAIGDALGVHASATEAREYRAASDSNLAVQSPSATDTLQSDNDNDGAVDNDNDVAADNDNEGAVDKDSNGIDDVTGQPVDDGEAGDNDNDDGS